MQLLTTREVMARLGVSRPTVGRMVADGRLHKLLIKAYKTPRYDADEVDALFMEAPID